MYSMVCLSYKVKQLYKIKFGISMVIRYLLGIDKVQIIILSNKKSP